MTCPAGASSVLVPRDRLAIRELFDAYAHCADRLDAKGQMALFTEDTHFVVYTSSSSSHRGSGLIRHNWKR
jgi:hypothetical protein